MPDERKSDQTSREIEWKDKSGLARMIGGFLAGAAVIFIGCTITGHESAAGWTTEIMAGSLIVGLLLHWGGSWLAERASKKDGDGAAGMRVAIWIALAVLLVMIWGWAFLTSWQGGFR